MKIGFFDSGKGGTSVLSAVKSLLPDAEYKYIADSKNCPYGEKSDVDLKKITKLHVDNLKSWGAEIIVIACNTATTRCIEYLRGEFPELKFVGTEPAIKLAAESNAKNILVMATPGTIKSERLQTLVKSNQKPGQNITLLACPGLADAIEHDQNIASTLDQILEGIPTADFDLAVLGCTHYSLIKPEIQRKFPSAKLVDGNEGVAKRVKSLTC